MLPRLLIFDLDSTLAESKQPISASMSEALGALLSTTKVAVMSGGAFPQLNEQVVSRLSSNAPLESLYILPTSGAALFEYVNGVWKVHYEERLSDDDVATITTALTAGATSTGFIDFTKPAYGPYIENRGSQISLSALGQAAPVEEKQVWDPSREKRIALQAAIAPRLPGFDVKMGGLTTIDVTKKGMNKAFGVRKLSEVLSIPISEMLYVGDELRAGGNDEVVIETGIPTRAVTDPADTEAVIRELLAS